MCVSENSARFTLIFENISWNYLQLSTKSLKALTVVGPNPHYNVQSQCAIAGCLWNEGLNSNLQKLQVA